MKKLLLAAIIPFSAAAVMQYNTETSMYYSEALTEDMDALRYHCLAHYCSMLLEIAEEQGVELTEMYQHIREVLIKDRSREAEILYKDLSFLWS